MNATSSPRETWVKKGAYPSTRQAALEICAPQLIKNRNFPPKNCSSTKILAMRRWAGLPNARKVILSQSGVMHKLKINGVHNFSFGQGLGEGRVASGDFYLKKMSPTLPKALFF